MQSGGGEPSGGQHGISDIEAAASAEVETRSSFMPAAPVARMLPAAEGAVQGVSTMLTTARIANIRQMPRRKVTGASSHIGQVSKRSLMPW